jgi:hypothetical protein
MAFRTLFVLLLSPAFITCEAREKPFIRDPDEEAPPPLPANEADQAGDVSDDPYATIVPLNDVLFKPNVLQMQDEDAAVHWVVYFCPNWWEPCRNLLKPFALQSAEWQARVNDGLLHNQIRFARVDCASHKPLCNSQNVDNYPTVQHYFQGRIVSTWSANGRNDDKRLGKWLGAELSAVPAASTVLRKAADPSLVWRKLIDTPLMSRDRMMDFLVLFGVLALNFWNVCNNPAVVQKRKGATVWQPPKHGAAPATAGNRLDGILPEEWRAHSGDMRSLPGSIEL